MQPTPAELFAALQSEDPYGFYARLRSESPVLRISPEMLALCRHEDCAALLSNRAFGHLDPEDLDTPRQTAGWTGDGSPERSPQVKPARSMLRLNPPDHTRLRRLVFSAFTPKRVEALSGRVARLVDSLLDGVVERGGTFDLIDQLARPLPVVVICELLGVDQADRHRLVTWSDALARSIDPPLVLDAPTRERIVAAREEFAEFLSDLIEQRRVHPGEDLISGLVAAHDQGGRLSREEVISTCILLLVAGHETTTNLIGLGTRSLLAHPQQMALLAADPEQLAERAVEEFLRFDSPVQLTARVALEPAEIAGVHLERGALVLCLIGAANRDPEAHTDPDRLDITREPTRHLAFGHGIHFCLGAPLARMEARVAFSHLLRRLPGLVSAGPVTWNDNMILHGPSSLPLRWSET